MKTVRSIKLPISLSKTDSVFIKEQQKSQSSMIRSAYCWNKDGKDQKEIRRLLDERFPTILDSWYKQSAIYSAMGMVQADKELKIETRIFCSKGLFNRRKKGLITKEEWREYRLQDIYLVGEGPKHGNRKFDFFGNKVVFKPFKGKKIEIILPNLKKNIRKLWNVVIQSAEEKKTPITVSLNSTHITLSFDFGIQEQQKKIIKNRFCGIDMNPNFIGVTIFDGPKLINSKHFDLSLLTGKGISENKLQHETRQIAVSLAKYLRYFQVDKVFIEDLKFKPGNKNKGRNFNRLTQNQWKRNTFLSSLSKFFTLIPLNAAYTSTIGNTLYPTLPDPLAASAEIAQRGRRLLITKNKKFYPELPTLKYLQDLWKEKEIPVCGSWKELHSWLKNAKVKYRVPIPLGWVSRTFQSLNSNVKIYDGFILGV